MFLPDEFRFLLDEHVLERSPHKSYREFDPSYNGEDFRGYVITRYDIDQAHHILNEKNYDLYHVMLEYKMILE